MYRCFYELKRVPDFSLSKYSSLSETGPNGVISQHSSFWRQMNQWGKLFQGSIHLLYKFMPEKEMGERMQVALCLESQSPEGITCAKQIMEASVLAPYYDRLIENDRYDITSDLYEYQINMFKKERYIESTSNRKDLFYVASEWKINSSARLYSMMKMLSALNQRCIYMVSLYPIEYSDTLKKDLAYPMERLRELSSFRVKTGSNSVSSGGKDEGAKEALDYYEDLIENLQASPHFLVNVQSLCENQNCAKMILDAAACEAVQEGTYDLYGEKYGGDVKQILEEGFQCLSEEMQPRSLMAIPYLYTADEVSAIALLPVLYEGESIELPKETVPEKMNGMLLGMDREKHPIFYPWSLLSKHAFLAGMPGSGKTNTMMYFVTNMHKAGIPVLVMEPAKKEYRILATLDEMEGTYLFSPSANSMFPIHINPFEFPRGMKLSEHINALLDVFNGTFLLDPPMPMLLTEGIQACYEELGWIPGMINMGELSYPTMTMLYDNIKRLFDKYQYAADIRSNLESVLQVRIGSLMQREMGDIFDVEKSTFPPEEWIRHSAIIELASLGTAPTNFMMLLLLTLIREVLGLIPYHPDQDNENKPRHVIFLEEAHNLIANTSVQMAGTMDPKIAATAFIKDMLAEVRALGEGIVIADQLPTAMAPEVVKNTSLKIGLRLTSADERNLLGETMSADCVQMEQMGVFLPGQCLVGYEKLLKPFELRIPAFQAKEDVLNDMQLFHALLEKDSYYTAVKCSWAIIGEKYRKRLEAINKEADALRTSVLNRCRVWKHSPAEKREQVEREITLKKKKYNQIIDAYIRLGLDSYLYYGVFEIISRRIKCDLSTERQMERCDAYLKLRNKYIQILSKPIKESREAFIDALRVIPNWTNEAQLNEKRERLKRQQEMIKNTWATWE